LQTIIANHFPDIFFRAFRQIKKRYPAAMTTYNASLNGFSLLELLLVLGLLALLGRFSMVGWHNYQQQGYLDETSQQLLYFLHRKQVEAAWHNQSYAIHVIHLAAERWQISLHSTAEKNCLSAADTGAGKGTGKCFSPFWSDVALLKDLPNPVMQFYGQRGGAIGGHITLSNPAGRVRIVLSARGRLRRCSEGSTFRGIPLC
jgi:prepilin peptidase dependent protein A